MSNNKKESLQLPELGSETEVIINESAIHPDQAVQGDTFQEKLENLWKGIGRQTENSNS